MNQDSSVRGVYRLMGRFSKKLNAQCAPNLLGSFAKWPLVSLNLSSPICKMGIIILSSHSLPVLFKTGSSLGQDRFLACACTAPRTMGSRSWPEALGTYALQIIGTGYLVWSLCWSKGMMFSKIPAISGPLVTHSRQQPLCSW